MYTMAKEKTTPHSYRIPDSLYERLKEKVGYISIPVVIRRLIERYVKGEIELDEKD